MAELTEEELSKMSPDQIAEIQKQNCIFCKIAAGEIPAKKVYEDDYYIGILDINPASEGHVLVIPKKHYQILPQMDNETVGQLSIAIQTISAQILKALNAEGVTIFIANGAAAGQKAPHFMAHVIPRKTNDGLPLNPASIELSLDEYTELTSKIRIQSKTPQISQEKPKTTVPTKNEPIITNKNNEVEVSQIKNNNIKSSVKSKKTIIDKTQKPIRKPNNKKSQEVTQEKTSTPDLDMISRLFTRR